MKSDYDDIERKWVECKGMGNKKGRIGKNVDKRGKGPSDPTNCSREKKDVGEMWILQGGEKKGDRETFNCTELPPEGSTYKATSLSLPHFKKRNLETENFQS
jgi:hypothetical protein